MSRSHWENICEMADPRIVRLIDSMDEQELRMLPHDWSLMARPEQLPPDGDWRIWLILAGRGFGKTRSGAEWVRRIAESDGTARIALVGASLHEARSVMVEGESGLLGIAPWWERPQWFPALRKLVWKSGAQARVFGASEPESLRGPQFSHGWADELAKWPDARTAWDNLMLCLRLGDKPRLVATTTPRPLALLRQLMTDGGTAVTRGRSRDNKGNLAPGFLRAMLRDYGGTRLGRQELDGELLDDLEGALWTRERIDRCRIAGSQLPRFDRVVVGVDPPAGTQGDACGISVVALGADGKGYVLADATVQGQSPDGWARAVAGAAIRFGADRVVAEANNGGAMVESVLRACERNLPVRLVHASRGKAARAEPVAAMYEAGRVHHAGCFPQLEDQMCGIVAGGGYAGPGRSPDRLDALVWALSALMLNGQERQSVRRL